VVCGLLVKPVPFPEICETDAQKELRELEEERKRKTEKRTDKDNANLKREISEIEQKIEALKKKLCYEKPHTKVQIECGLALDCRGNELVVRRRRIVDLMRSLSAD